METGKTTDDSVPVEDNLLELEPIGSESSNDPIHVDLLPLVDQISNTAYAYPSPLAEKSHPGYWFLDPQTFEYIHDPMPLPGDFDISDLHSFIERVQDWMKVWVKTRSNLFIHPRLYGKSLPPCLQVAFTTLCAYQNKTPATTETILCIVNEQADVLTSLWDMEKNHSAPSLLDDLARVHALLCYQLVGLFDGDIRARHLADKRSVYMTMFLEAAVENGRRFGREQLASDTTQSGLLQEQVLQEQMWNAWILVESLRRTWLVSLAIQAGFDALKQSWSSCYGSIMCTHRQGLWDANSSSSWTKICAEKDVYFFGRLHGSFLLNGPVEDVDPFSRTILEITFGKQRYLKWVENM